MEGAGRECVCVSQWRLAFLCVYVCVAGLGVLWVLPKGCTRDCEVELILRNGHHMHYSDMFLIPSRRAALSPRDAVFVRG